MARFGGIPTLVSASEDGAVRAACIRSPDAYGKQFAYGALLALMYLFQRKLMYLPDASRTAPVAAGLSQAAEGALHSDDGEMLIAWHMVPREIKPVVLYFQVRSAA